MTYSTELNKISRRKIDLLILKMDYCNLTFGIAPCTATGVECYNTFPTTKDAPNYDKGEKEYKYVNEGLPPDTINDYYPAKPYIKSFNDLPTEIKEKDTVVKRLKIQLYDEDDNDVGTDPYRSSRTTITGTYWKKWLARNSNYKGRIVELHEGFEGMEEADFEMKFAGTIDNIAINKGTVTIEAVDLMKKLSETEYPFDRGISLYAVLPDVHSAVDETAMLALPAVEDDYCRRTDFIEITGVSTAVITGILAIDTYYYTIVGYDEQGRVFGKSVQVSQEIFSTLKGIRVSWSSLANVVTYRIYGGTTSYPASEYYAETAGTSYDHTAIIGITLADIPTKSNLLMQLTAGDPTVIGNWTDIHTALSCDIDAQTDLDAAGYVVINKEVISYTSITDNTTYYTLEGIVRNLFNTKPDRYDIYTSVKGLLKLNAGNPFTHLKTLLDRAGISASYIDTKFTTYESAWSGINFSTRVIVKKTKLNKIYFQLVNAVNCMSWVGEDGKIKILKHTENPGSYATITDEANIIHNSAKVDLNEESRRTRWLFYWNRYDLEKGIEDEESYNRANVTVDATAESPDEYNDEQEDLQFCTFLNDDSDVVADINTWIDSTLLDDRQTRTRDAQTLFFCDVELKDNDIKTGDVIKLSTDQLQDKDGVDFSEVQFRVIKKEPEGNKISLKLKRRFT